jgi:ClpP class serine protease
MDILLRSLMARPWYIEPAYARAQLPFINTLMAGDTAAFTAQNQKEHAPQMAIARSGFFHMEATEGMSTTEAGVLVITMEGPLLKKTMCGIPGTAALIDTLKEADQDARILAVIFRTDCPGGTVDNTLEFCQAVAEFKKPIYFWVNGMSTSASAFVSAPATGIYASSNLCTFGSIGVRAQMEDIRVAQELQGIKTITIRATTSPDKGKEHEAALDGDHTILQAILDEMDAEFMSAMRSHRNAQEEALTGKTYHTQEAIRLGLCDGVTSLEDLIIEAHAVGSKHQQANN